MWGIFRTFGFSKKRMRFTGTIEAKLDVKGRVFLPSEFRRQMGGLEQRLVLKRDVYQPCLVVYPYEVWSAEVGQLRERLNRWNPRHAMVLRQFMADAVLFTLDANGRFILPKRLLEACRIERTVEFVGVDDRVEVWNPDVKAEKFLSPEDFAQALEDVSELLE